MQQRFVEAYFTAPDAKTAAIQAGYAAGSAHQAAMKLLDNEMVSEALEELRGERREEFHLTIDWLIEQLAAVAEEAREEKQYNATIRAYELLGKSIGMFPKESITVDARTQVLALGDYTSEQLMAIAQGSEYRIDVEQAP